MLEKRTISLALCAIVLLVLSSTARPMPVHAQLSIAPTDIVVEVYGSAIDLRPDASLAAQVAQTLNVGARVAWDGQTKQADGRNWLEVKTSTGTFWTAPDSQVLLLADPSAITLNMDRSAVFKSADKPVTLYNAPNLSKVLTQIPANIQLTVSDGPVLADLYTWWQVRTADDQLGWIPDSRWAGLQVTTALNVSGYQVCDGFNLKQFGAAGWDSIVQSLKNWISPSEQIVCLASTNFKGSGAPVVVVLTRIGNHDTLRLFDNVDGADWAQIFSQTGDEYVKTERLSMHDLTNDGKPVLVWLGRHDGTGDVLDVNIFRYTPVTGVQRVLLATSYKGSIQINGGGISIFQAEYKANEPNCCASQIQRTNYVWHNNEFVVTAVDIHLNPYYLQGLPKQ